MPFLFIIPFLFPLAIQAASLQVADVPYQQGGTVLLKVSLAKSTAPPRLLFLKQNLPLYVESRTSQSVLYRAVVGIPVETRPGWQILKVFYTTRDGSVEQISRRLRITKDPLFKTVRLKVSSLNSQTAATLTKETGHLKETGQGTSPKRWWRGSFILPVLGRVSEWYGVRRIYNNGLASWFHKGVDLAAPQGSPVVSSNRGKVLLAEKLADHGNTVLIDHGQGVETIYLHLFKLKVRKGQTVLKGQVIGMVGATGLATGPHLHWSLTVGGVSVNPVDWLNSPFI